MNRLLVDHAERGDRYIAYARGMHIECGASETLARAIVAAADKVDDALAELHKLIEIAERGAQS